MWLFPGRFRRRKSDSLGPRPASVSSLRARVHTHVDAQHEAGHLTQAASAEQINRRTDTARVSERPRPGGNAGQCKPKIPRIQGCAPPGGVLWFCSASPYLALRGSKPGFGTGVEIRPGSGFGSGSAETQEKVKKNRSGSKTPFVPPFGHSRKKSPREKPGLEPGTKTQKKGSSGQKPG